MYAVAIADHEHIASTSDTIVGQNRSMMVMYIGKHTSQLNGLKAIFHFCGILAKVINHKLNPTLAISTLI